VDVENSRFHEFVGQYLVSKDARCHRHCGEAARFLLLSESAGLIGAYVCPKWAVSRVVYFTDKPEPGVFKKYLADQLGEGFIKDRDVRGATRHGWELGGRAEEEIKEIAELGIVQYYWAFSPRTENAKQFGLFICPRERGGCGKMHVRLKVYDSILCQSCRGH
jgi:hypothetical protein